MHYNKTELSNITENLVKNICKFLQYFHIEYVEFDKMIRCACFIHGGDNKTAMNIYHKADLAYHYKCRTHNCEIVFGKSIIGMVRGLLSHRKFGWTNNGDETVSFQETIKFIKNFLQDKDLSINEDITNYDNKSEFSYIVSHISDTQPTASGISRIEIRNKLLIPSRYFIQRGFTQNILDEYDIGECRDKSKDMKFRAVVPIYNENYDYIGSSGRSIYEQCKKCKGYHYSHSKCMNIPKWKHSKGLNRNLCLYNLHKAKQYILRSHVAVVVESPANVWRLEEAGIHNAVCTFGTNIHDKQRYLLDKFGAMALILLLDNDEAGEKTKIKIKEELNKIYALYFPTIEKNDIAEMSVIEVRKQLKPYIENIMEIYS